MSAVLEVRDLTKTFGGISAVAGVSFEVHAGEILGLIGPNGSGKSTLFNCILGQLAPSSGEVRFDGQPITGRRACDLSRLGIGRTFQLLQVFPQLSVRENLILAGQEHRGSMWSRLVGRRDAGQTEAANRMIGFFRLEHLAEEKAGSLSYGQQKLLDSKGKRTATAFHRELGKLILLPALEQFVASLAPLPEPDPVQP